MKHFNFIPVLLIVVFWLFVGTTFSQESSGGVPISFIRSFDGELPTVKLPDLDNDVEKQRAIEIVKSECKGCKNNYYGRGLDLSIDIKAKGKLEILADNSKLWLLKIESTTAHGMQFYFDKFNIPEGARLYIFKEDSSMVLGGFTSRNNPKNKNSQIPFGTQIINGKKIIIEYHEPVGVEFEGKLSINNIIHVFDKSGPFVGSGSQYCQINVTCPEGNGWNQESSSVGIILGYNQSNELQGFCTGALLNNTSQDGTPYFLTAKHCINNTLGLYDPTTWMFLFNHQTTTCGSDGSDVSSYSGQAIYGSIVRSSDGTGSPTSDYLLLELNTSEAVLSSYNVCYAGWDLTSSPQGPFIGLHHPGGDVKKISTSPFPVESTPYFLTNIDPNANHWKIKWNNTDPGTNGITQSGSSGSPLFDNNHRIVGQLHGGLSHCASFLDMSTGLFFGPEEPDWYGKFSTSWQNGGFAFWLDPFSTGQTSINTYCPLYTGPGGGGPGGGGGGVDPCTAPQNRRLEWGYLINGKNQLITEVCPTDDIILSGIHPLPGCPQSFSPNVDVQSSTCIFCGCNESGAFGCNTNTPFTCTCYFARLFISVTLVDGNLNPAGPEYTKWQNFQTPDLQTLGTYALIPSFNLNWAVPIGGSLVIHPYYPSPYIIFQSGQTYRVKLATSDFDGWSEHTKYIHFYSDNRTITGQNITSDVYGRYITINNSTVTQPIEVVAKELITITPNSTLYAGDYRIDNFGCSDFLRVGLPTDVSYSKGETHNYYQPELNDRSLYNDELDDFSNSNFSIYPNPTSGIFNVDIEDNDEPVLIEVYDIMGKKVSSKNSVSDNITIKITDQPKGVYFVKISIGDKVYNEKIIYQ